MGQGDAGPVAGGGVLGLHVQSDHRQLLHLLLRRAPRVCGQHAGHVRLHHALSTGRLLVTLGRLRAPSGRWFVYGEWLWEGGGAGKGLGGDCSGGGRFLRRSRTV